LWDKDLGRFQVPDPAQKVAGKKVTPGRVTDRGPAGEPPSSVRREASNALQKIAPDRYNK